MKTKFSTLLLIYLFIAAPWLACKDKDKLSPEKDENPDIGSSVDSIAYILSSSTSNIRIAQFGQGFSDISEPDPALDYNHFSINATLINGNLYYSKHGTLYKKGYLDDKSWSFTPTNGNESVLTNLVYANTSILFQDKYYSRLTVCDDSNGALKWDKEFPSGIKDLMPMNDKVIVRGSQEVFAFDLQNGSLLWTQKLPINKASNVNQLSSNLSDVFLMEGSLLKAINSDTGKDHWTIDLTREQGLNDYYQYYLSEVEDGILKLSIVGIREVIENGVEYPPYISGSEQVLVDVQSGKILNQDPTPPTNSLPKWTIEGKTITEFDATTGNKIWEYTADAEVSHILREDDVVYATIKKGPIGTLVAIKMDNQQLLWEYLLESSSGGYYPETIKNLMYAQNMVLIDQLAGIVGIDAQTGKVSGASIYYDGLLEGRCTVVLKSGKTIPAQ